MLQLTNRNFTQCTAALILGLACFMISYAAPAPANITFGRIRAENSAIAINKINAFAQDSNGLIWIGTADGVHRYDGNRMQIYDGTNSELPSSFVVSLLSVPGGIWIGTDAGAAFYNEDTGQISPLDIAADSKARVRSKVTALTADSHGNVWMGVNEQGIFRYAPHGGKLENRFGTQNHKLPANVRCIHFTPEGKCLAGLYYKGLYELEWDSSCLRPLGGKFFENDNLVAISQAPVGLAGYYIFSSLHGLVFWDGAEEFKTVFMPERPFEAAAMSMDDAGCWLCTSNGAYRYSFKNKTATRYVSPHISERNAECNDFTCAFTDSYGGTWLGTSGSGVCHGNPVSRNFRKIALPNGHGTASHVRALSADDEGYVWAATGNGLFRLTPSGRVVQEPLPTLPSDLFSVCNCGSHVWFSSGNGIHRLERNTATMRNWTRLNDSTEMKEVRLYGLFCPDGETVFLGTTLGLYVFCPETEDFRSFDGLEKMYITDFSLDSDGTYWLATFAHGIVHYNPATNSIIRIYDRCSVPELTTDKINGLTLDHCGNVWAATFGAGIVKIDPNGTAEAFSRTRGTNPLPSNIAYQIFEDPMGNIWASSNKGLVSLDRSTGLNALYTVSHGLVNDDFAESRGVKTMDGSIFLCSADGTVVFKPLEFVNKQRPFPLAIYAGGTQVGEGNIRLEGGSNRLELLVYDSARLSPDITGNVFYRLDKGGWSPLPTDGKLVLDDLATGSHTVEFCEKGLDNAVIPLHTPVRFRVASVFYKSPVGITLLVLVLIAIALGVAYYALRHNKKRAALRKEEQRQRLERDAYNEKIALFSSAVSRLRAPLALIRNPLDNILRNNSADPELTADLMIINNGAEKLYRLLDEFSDFQVERCSYVLDRRSVELTDFIRQRLPAGIETEIEATEPVSAFADALGLERILEAVFNIARLRKCTRLDIKIESTDSGLAAICVAGLGLEPFYTDIPLAEGEAGTESQTSSALKTVKMMADLHGGHIKMLPEASSETTLGIYLPLSEESADTPTEPTVKKHTILVLELSEEALAAVVNSLARYFNVVQVQSSVVALDLILRDRYAAVVAQASKSNPMGINLCRELASISGFGASTPVLVLADAQAKHTLAREAVAAGATMVANADDEPEYIVECVKALVKRSYGGESLLVVTGQGSVQPVNADDVRFIQALEAVVTENLTDADLENELLAHKLCMSKSTLLRRTKKALDTTPKEYILRKRLAMAARMLSTPGVRINEVCYACGFNTPSYFAKCFRRVYGCLPSEYKGTPPINITDEG